MSEQTTSDLLPTNESVNPNQNIIDGLRKLAVWFEEHPEMIDLKENVDFKFYFWEYKRETALPKAKAIAKALKTFIKKIDSSYYRPTKMFGELKVQFTFMREGVCEKVTVTKPVEEWKCNSLLEDGDINVTEEE